MSELVVALLGIVLGAAATGVLTWLTERQRRIRELHVATARCFDRLEKLQLLRAEDASGELSRLGPDMDAYLAAIAAAPGTRRFRRHVALYEQLRPILILQDLGAVPGAAKAFGDELKRLRARFDTIPG